MNYAIALFLLALFHLAAAQFGPGGYSRMDDRSFYDNMGLDMRTPFGSLDVYDQVGSNQFDSQQGYGGGMYGGRPFGGMPYGGMMGGGMMGGGMYGGGMGGMYGGYGGVPFMRRLRANAPKREAVEEKAAEEKVVAKEAVVPN